VSPTLSRGATFTFKDYMQNIKIRGISGWTKRERCPIKDEHGEQCNKDAEHEQHSFPEPMMSPEEVLKRVQEAAAQGNIVLATEMEPDRGGFVIQWSSDAGFGELTVWMNPDGTIEIDDEAGSRATCLAILATVLGQGVTVSEKMSRIN
jgi:hypothetical protein